MPVSTKGPPSPVQGRYPHCGQLGNCAPTRNLNSPEGPKTAPRKTRFGATLPGLQWQKRPARRF